MKRIVLILLLSFAYVAQAQYLAPMNAKNSGSWSVGLLRIDSSFNLRLFDTAVTKLAFPSNLNNRWARQGQRLYVYNGSFFELADNVPAIDTSSLSARINARVKYTDTASMLVGYVRAARLNDTALAIRSAIPNVSGKVNYSDTAAMLSPYLRKADTTAMLSKYLRKADTTAMLLPYARKTLVNDTAAAIRAAIPNVSGKVNYSDTAAMLAPYYRTATATAALALKQNLTDTTTWDATKKNLADTALALRALIPSGTDTTSLSNRINERVKYTDTASMLAPYATDAEVALKLNITDTANMRIRPIAGSNMTITGTYPNVTFAASGGTVIDTTSLSTRIDARVKYTDTASMLSPYLRSAAAATTYVPYTGATSNVNLGEYQATVGQVTLDQTPTQTAGVGVLRWNDSDGTADLGLKGGNVSLQIGQEEVVRVVNKTGANLLESQYHAVYVSGAQGQRLKVGNALAMADSSSAATIGLVTENIDLNQEGFITTNGLVRNINTTGSLQGETWNDGDLLFLSGTTAGQITNVKPIAPTHTVIIGYVVYAHAINGKIFVKVDNGYELDELHNVRIVSAANNEGLFYDSAAKLWENKSISTVLGYTPANNATVVKYTDTATMLSPYYRTATATAALATKVNYTDTATMLTPYLRKGDTLSMLTAYARGQRLIDTAAALQTRITAAGNDWKLTGNSGTSSSTNFIGTTDNVDLVFRRNSATAGWLNHPLFNTSYGVNSLPLTSTGGYATAIGHGALSGGTTGNFNIAIGYNAGTKLSSSASNIAIGRGTLGENGAGHTGNENVAIGEKSMFSTTTATRNAGYGWFAGYNLTTGNNNTFLGPSSGGLTTTGSNNISVGYESTTGTTGSKNLTLSYQGNIPTATASNQMNIGNVIWGLDCSGTTTTAAGRIGIGTNAPNASSILDLTSTTQGLGLPSMTTTQQNAIATPRTGLTIYNSTLLTPHFYNGSVWTGGWNKRGNSGTDAANDFIGTTDGVDVMFRRGNVRAGWLSGTSNVSFGVSSMPTTTTTGGSAAFGHSALSALTSGLYNNAFGWRALMNCTTGRENTAIGDQTLMTLTTGNYNVGIGTSTLINNNGNYNTGVGYRALLSNTTGGGNCAFGPQAAYGNKTGSNNAAFGYAALASDTTGSSNSAFGTQALWKTVGAQNTGIGNAAAYYSTSGNNNTSVGHYASFNLSTGANNTTLGTFAGQYLYASSNNVYLGYGAGDNFQHNAGDKNLLVGYRAFPAVYTGSNQLNLGNVLWGVDCSGTAQTPAGSLSVGVTAPNASALLDLTSTTKGFLPPRMTATQAAAIATPAEGLMVYVTNTGGVFTGKGWWGWNGAAWEKLNP